MYDFSVDYNSTDKSHLWNINKYLTIKNNVKWSSALLKKCLSYYLVLAYL